MEQVKLLSMSALLALLIWTSADALVNETEIVRVEFQPVPEAGTAGLLVVPAEPGKTFEVEVSGPRSIIEEVRGDGALPVRVPVVDRPTGRATVRLDRSLVKQTLIDANSAFRKLAIGAVQPGEIDVIVDHMVTRDIEVVIGRTTLSYETPPRPQPSTVELRLRESVLADWPAGSPFQIDIASDVDAHMRSQTPGTPVRKRYTLDTRPFGPGATIANPDVEVTATVQAERVTEEIRTVPILFAVSFSNLARSLRPVDRDGNDLSLMTQRIEVSGSPADVARLQSGETRVFGVLQLKQEDFESPGTLNLAIPEFHLPPGIDLASDPMPIEFQLVAAQASAGGGDARS